MSDMKLTLAEPKYLKDSVSIISELVNEASFKVTKNSIELTKRQHLATASLIDWGMNREELRQAIPPAYTEYIGRYLMDFIMGRYED